MKNKENGLVKGAVILIFALFVAKIISAMFKVPLTTLIGIEGMGYFATAYSVFNIIYNIAVAGLSVSVSKMVAKYMALGRVVDAKKSVKLSALIFLSVGMMGSLALFFTAKDVAILVGNEDAWLSIAAISPTVFLGCVISVYRGYFQGLQNMIPTAISQIMESAVKLVVGILFAYIVIEVATSDFYSCGIVFGEYADTVEEAVRISLPYASAAAILGVAVSTGVTGLYLFIASKLSCHRITKEQLAKSKKPYDNGFLVKEILKIATPVCVGALIINLTSFVDLFTVMNCLGDLAVSSDYFVASVIKYIPEGMSVSEIPNYLYGAYQTAYTLFLLVPSITVALGVSALPAISAHNASGNIKRVSNDINTSLKMIMLIAAPAGIGIGLLAGPILNMFYGSKENEVAVAIPILHILSVGIIFFALSGPLISMIQGIGRQNAPLVILLFCSIIKLVINHGLIAIPEVNINGAAVGTAVSYIIMFLLLIIFLIKAIKIKIAVVDIFIKPVVAGILCGGFAYEAQQFLLNITDSKYAILLSAMAGGVVYIISVICLKILKKSEIIMLPMGEKLVEILQKFDGLKEE